VHRFASGSLQESRLQAALVVMVLLRLTQVGRIASEGSQPATVTASVSFGRLSDFETLLEWLEVRWRRWHSRTVRLMMVVSLAYIVGHRSLGLERAHSESRIRAT